MRKRGITPEKIPSMSFSISEPELQLFGSNAMTGDYATWSYFQSIDSPENNAFVKKIKSTYGKKCVTSDSMEAGYYGVYLWKQAVEKAHSTDINHVRTALVNQSFNAPQGIVYVNKSQQMWEFVRIGKIRSDKQFTIIWSSQKAICPMAYPPLRSIATWKKLRAQLKQEEGKK